MGDYTYFSLRVKNAPGQTADLDEIDKAIRNDFDLVFDDKELGSYGGEAKWYNWEADMIELSLRFPDALFYLEGDGEERDDLWGWYFLNGWAQDDGIEVRYNRFDPNKLRRVALDAPECPLAEPVDKVDPEQLDALLTG